MRSVSVLKGAKLPAHLFHVESMLHVGLAKGHMNATVIKDIRVMARLVMVGDNNIYINNLDLLSVIYPGFLFQSTLIHC